MPHKSNDVPSTTRVLSTALSQLILKPQQSTASKLYCTLTLLVNSEIVQRRSINVHTGKCTSGKGHVMGRPKNENFSATTINKKAQNLDNSNCTETWFWVTSSIKMLTYQVILSAVTWWLTAEFYSIMNQTTDQSLIQPHSVTQKQS